MMKYGLTLNSPVGKLNLIASDIGLTAIEYNQPHQELPSNEIVEEAANQLRAYFDHKLQTFTIPLDLKGTDFELKIWNYLTKIPYGHTTNYGSIAKEISTIKAVRAVGRANGKNPIPIIVPCHRVIGSDGSLVGYALGLKVKKELLFLENPDGFGKQLQLGFD